LPSANSEIFQTQTFVHKETTYVVTAFIEPDNPMTIKVDVTQEGIPVVITYPDKMMVTLSYQVDLVTKFEPKPEEEDLKGIDAVDHLMKIAEDEVRRFV